MFFVLFVAAMCLISVLIYGFVQFDKVVAFEQTHYPDEWEADGSPICFFRFSFVRSIDGLFGKQFSQSACAMVWLFLTPDWIRQHTSTKLWLRRYRLCILVCSLGVLTMVWVGFLQSARVKPVSTAGIIERSASQR